MSGFRILNRIITSNFQTNKFPVTNNIFQRHFHSISKGDMTKRLPSEKFAKFKQSIWVEFTTLAAETKAVNLGQGFPDTPCPEFVANFLKEISEHSERVDYMQYTRGFGDPRLTSALAKLYSRSLGLKVNQNDDVLVTVGAYLALYYSFTAWLNNGDEVLILEPTYDSYVPQVIAAGGVPVPVILKLDKSNIDKGLSSADFKLDISSLESKVTPKTKMLVLTNPNNPIGKLYSRQELEEIAKFVEKHDLIVISDEVYEWHIPHSTKKSRGEGMIRFASLPNMYDRTITIGSAGKAFSITGWKIGWTIAPEHLSLPLRMLHQNCTFNTATPLQVAIARGFEKELKIFDTYDKTKDETLLKDSYLLNILPEELETRRDKLAIILKKAGLTPIIPEAGYFMLADYSNLNIKENGKDLREILNDSKYGPVNGGDEALDYKFVRWLCKEKNLATIPLTAFYSDEFKKDNEYTIRTCFFKSDTTMENAEKILLGLNI
uniref:Aminotran_1_2 domain-containing protein n=1 Tax=Parastrongyloides trichosuri TaxID=131310 RepID=A0A0N4Z0K8_PARTI